MTMFRIFLACLTLFTVAAVSPAQDSRLDGAFIQLDEANRNWPKEKWIAVLDKMWAAECNIVIIQSLQVRETCESQDGVRCDGSDEKALESYVYDKKSGGPDPVEIILAYADRHQSAVRRMQVYVGLRLNKKLEESDFLNDPVALKAELKRELKESIKLAQTVKYQYATVKGRYGLARRRPSFEGWYLPVELFNYKEKEVVPPGGVEGWVGQLNTFLHELALACKTRIYRPVAISPGFNNCEDRTHLVCQSEKEKCEDRTDLVDHLEMKANFEKLLKGSGISKVLLQDGVGERCLETQEDLDGKVIPFIESIRDACRNASSPGQEIEFWLNVESFKKRANDRVAADFDRFLRQLELGKGRAQKIVTFEFSHYLNPDPERPENQLLYDKYLELLSTKP